MTHIPPQLPRAFRNGFLLGCVVAGAVGVLGAMV